jgi:hypothetical protein
MLPAFLAVATDQAHGHPRQAVETTTLSAVASSGKDENVTGERRAIPSRRWRVVVTDPLVGSVTRKALDTAATWLEQPSCGNVLTDFSDPAGHSLAERLRAVDADVVKYLGLVLFVDDTRNPSCREGVVAIAVPGSRVVRLCGDVFKRTWQQDSTYTVAALIHEMLHTLGLGENPPASSEITRRVLMRCRRE